jgi:hypothetical protein
LGIFRLVNLFFFFQVAFCKVKLSLRVPLSIRSYSTNWQLHSRARRRAQPIQPQKLFAALTFSHETWNIFSLDQKSFII